MQTPCRERQLQWDDTLPRGLPRKPTLQTAAEFPGLPVFWEFVAQALLDESSADRICHAFELGSIIDALGDGAFVRDEIMVSFPLHDGTGEGGVALSVVHLVRGPNHQSLASRGEPRETLRSHQPRRGLRDLSACLGSGSGARPVCRVLGRQPFGALSPAAKPGRCLPRLVQLLARQCGSPAEWRVTSNTRENRPSGRVHWCADDDIIFVHLSYACPHVADTTRHVAV